MGSAGLSLRIEFLAKVERVMRSFLAFKKFNHALEAMGNFKTLMLTKQDDRVTTGSIQSIDNLSI